MKHIYQMTKYLSLCLSMAIFAYLSIHTSNLHLNVHKVFVINDR